MDNDGYVNINWINGNLRIVLKKGVLSYRIHVGHFTMLAQSRNMSMSQNYDVPKEFSGENMQKVKTRYEPKKRLV